jgi:16S rRNA processing protein RimM
MLKRDCFELGVIQKLHGIEGQMVALLDVDDASKYQKLDAVFVELKSQLVPYLIKSIKVQGKHIHLRLDEVDSVEKATLLRGAKLFLPLDKLPVLKNPNKFYYHEIIGFKVIDKDLGELGEVEDVFGMAHQDLIAMDYNGEEVLIPVLDNIVLTVDRKLKHLHVHLPEGLLDIYTSGPQTPDDAD